MKKVKIGTTNIQRRDTSLINSICTLSFDENCVAEVNEEYVEELLLKDPSLFVASNDYVAKVAKMEAKNKEEVVKINK